ncbi:unnamed protein product [Spirodela intermedia]|uniref:Uncharacterized protein n=1 Tax=Spirodela intermedia TaxID=51605 RepID=A0A7I8LGQ2_SPIIN|nr:unnamed protein product [Spirodela intermedia]
MQPVKRGPEREEQVEPAAGYYDPRVPNRRERGSASSSWRGRTHLSPQKKQWPAGSTSWAQRLPPNSQSTRKRRRAAEKQAAQVCVRALSSFFLSGALGE